MTSGFIEILIENAGVQAIAGLNRAGNKYKVYPVIAPQKEEQPYITVYQASNDPLASLTKDLASQLDYPRVIVNCWGKSFRQVELMSEAVRAALDKKSSQTDAGYNFHSIWMVDEREGYDPETSLFLHTLTFGVELKRFASDVYESLAESAFVKWGGLWNWSDHANALPTDVSDGKMWITVGDLSEDEGEGRPFVSGGSLMTAKHAGANSFDEFNFNQ